MKGKKRRKRKERGEARRVGGEEDSPELLLMLNRAAQRLATPLMLSTNFDWIH